MADVSVRRHMLELHKAGGIESLGTVKWQLTLCLVAVYLICYFSLWKGISTSGKVSRQVNHVADIDASPSADKVDCSRSAARSLIGVV